MISLHLQQIIGSTDTYDILNDGVVVGACQLRHVPTKSAEMPEGFENHIYYEIKPEFQGKGFATEAFKQLLLKAQSIDLEEVILNIADNNIASQKVAERNGAILLEQKPDANGNIYRKYNISLK